MEKLFKYLAGKKKLAMRARAGSPFPIWVYIYQTPWSIKIKKELKSKNVQKMSLKIKTTHILEPLADWLPRLLLTTVMRMELGRTRINLHRQLRCQSSSNLQSRTRTQQQPTNPPGPCLVLLPSVSSWICNSRHRVSPGPPPITSPAHSESDDWYPIQSNPVQSGPPK